MILLVPFKRKKAFEKTFDANSFLGTNQNATLPSELCSPEGWWRGQCGHDRSLNWARKGVGATLITVGCSVGGVRLCRVWVGREQGGVGASRAAGPLAGHQTPESRGESRAQATIHNTQEGLPPTPQPVKMLLVNISFINLLSGFKVRP